MHRYVIMILLFTEHVITPFQIALYSVLSTSFLTSLQSRRYLFWNRTRQSLRVMAFLDSCRFRKERIQFLYGINKVFQAIKFTMLPLLTWTISAWTIQRYPRPFSAIGCRRSDSKNRTRRSNEHCNKIIAKSTQDIFTETLSCHMNRER